MKHISEHSNIQKCGTQKHVSLVAAVMCIYFKHRRF